MRPGRILVRIHCGMLMDANKSQFSATLTGILAVNGLILPGGVCETWFLVA
jgi:hypothetical protein